MVSLQVGNPRLVADDDRFYEYWHDGEEIGRMLKSCGLEIVTVASSWLQHNVYNEPNINLRWDSFFCTCSFAGSRLPPPKETTALAYDLIVNYFVDIHQNKPLRMEKGGSFDQFLERIPQSEGIILDAGCGPGHYAPLFWNRGFDVIGLDLSPNMIGYARESFARELDKHPKSKFIVGDMCELSEPYNSNFDGVFCMAAFQHIPRAEDVAKRTLEGFLEALKPGAPLFINVQLERATGYEPDGRFTEGYANQEEAINTLKCAGFVGVTVVATNTIGKKDNTFKRAVELRFVDLIAYRPRVPAFASYSRSDSEIVNDIRSQLNDIVNLWIDIDQINFGDDIRKTICTAISESQYVLLFVSKNSMASKWVQWELEQVTKEQERRNKQGMIIPVRIDDTQSIKELEILYECDLQKQNNNELQKLREILLKAHVKKVE